MKIRFNGFSLRIGSAYCTAEDASAVASAFRKVAFMNKDGEIDFHPSLHSRYDDVTVRIYLPFTTTIDTVSVADYLSKWLATMKRKPGKEERYFGKKMTESCFGAKKLRRANDEGKYQSAADSALGRPAVLGKRGPRAHPERSVGTKAPRTGNPSMAKQVVSLEMENEMLKREIAMLKEGTGMPTTQFMNDNGGSGTASSHSTTSSSGDEKDEEMPLAFEMSSLPSYNPLFVSILHVSPPQRIGRMSLRGGTTMR